MREAFARAARAAVLSMPVLFGLGTVLAGLSNKAQAQTVSVTSGDLLDLNTRRSVTHFSPTTGYSRVNINGCSVRGGVEFSSGANDRVEFYLRASGQICSTSIMPDHAANVRLVDGFVPRNVPNIGQLIGNQLRAATGLSQTATQALARGTLRLSDLSTPDRYVLAQSIVTVAATQGQTLSAQSVFDTFRLIPPQQTLGLTDLSALTYGAQAALVSGSSAGTVNLGMYTQQAAQQLGVIGTATQRLGNVLRAAEGVNTRALIVENVASSLQGVTPGRQGFAEIELAGGVRVNVLRSGRYRAYIGAEGGVATQIWRGAPTGVAAVCMRPHIAAELGVQAQLAEGLSVSVTGGIASNLPCVGATANSVMYAERLYRGTLRVGISQTFGGSPNRQVVQEDRARDPSLRMRVFAGITSPSRPVQMTGVNGFRAERLGAGYTGGFGLEREIQIGRPGSRMSATYGAMLSGGTFTGISETNTARTSALLGRLNTEAVTDRVAQEMGISRAELNRLGANSARVTQALARYQAEVLSASRRNTVRGYQGAMMLTGSLRYSFQAAGDPTVYAFGGVGVQARYTQSGSGARVGIAPQAMVGVGAEVGVGRINDRTALRVFGEVGSVLTGPDISAGAGGVAYGQGLRVSHIARIGVTFRGF